MSKDLKKYAHVFAKVKEKKAAASVKHEAKRKKKMGEDYVPLKPVVQHLKPRKK